MFVWPGATFPLFLLVAVEVRGSLLAEGEDVPAGRRGSSPAKRHRKGGMGDERWHYERQRDELFIDRVFFSVTFSAAVG